MRQGTAQLLKALGRSRKLCADHLARLLAEPEQENLAVLGSEDALPPPSDQANRGGA